MLAFLQGVAFGVLVSVPAWSLIGFIRPRLTVGRPDAGRLEVAFRCLFLWPAAAVLLWLTSLWGGLGPALAGWLAGLVAIPASAALEHAVRRALAAWRRRPRPAPVERGVRPLDAHNPPASADATVTALCAAKRALLDARRHELARQVDRLHSRRERLRELLAERFDPDEITRQRAERLLQAVCDAGLDCFAAMATRLDGVGQIDAHWVRRRLADGGATLPREEREALQRRLTLLDETERGLSADLARHEAILAALDDAAVRIARVETRQDRAGVSVDRALADLQRFSAGAGRYSRDAGEGEQHGG